jgi:hypothetical protein
MPAMAEIWDGLTRAIMAYPLVPLSLMALGPVVVVAFARNSTGASIVVVGTVIGLVLAVTTDALFLQLAFWGVLFLVAIGFLIFGRPRRTLR